MQRAYHISLWSNHTATLTTTTPLTSSHFATSLIAQARSNTCSELTKVSCETLKTQAKLPSHWPDLTM